MERHFRAATESIGSGEENGALASHGDMALAAFDQIVEVLAGEDPDIRGLLRETRENLADSYLAAAAGRMTVAFSMLRGAMEGLFMALFYRQQAMSLHLWARGKTFHMVHQLLDDKHEFCAYFKVHFSDERFKQAYPGMSEKRVLEEARDTYDCLCRAVHKTASTTEKTRQTFQASVERVFRIFLSFLDREDDLPGSLAFPRPSTFQEMPQSRGQDRSSGKKK
jgi:hypothetical protein